MITLTWTGFIPEIIVRALFIEISAKVRPREATQFPTFFAMSAHSFGTEVANQQKGFTILYLPSEKDDSPDVTTSAQARPQEPNNRLKRNYVLWEF
ncbi:hypothetical protein P7C71_g3591, partial [Lecanoromycetidae sp. Uapishka_2]